MVAAVQSNAPGRAGVIAPPLTRRAVGAVLTAYIATRSMILLILYASSIAIPHSGTALRPPVGPRELLLGSLTQWDGVIYLSIAAHGYQGQAGRTVFFPLYPLLINLVSRVFHHPALVGMLISNGALLAALFYLYALARREYDDDDAARAVLYLAAAPAAVFLSAVYTESLFILFVAATFYYARGGAWGPAAGAGLLAAVTRNTGVVLAVVIALESLHQAGTRWRPRVWTARGLASHVRAQLRHLAPAWRGLLAAAVVPVSLLAYMVYLTHTTGDPLAFVHGQRAWEKNNAVAHVGGILGAVSGRAGAGGQILSGAGQHSGVVMLNALVAVAFLPLVLIAARTMRPAYVVYAVVTYLIPIVGGHGVISMIRYVLMLLPCFMVLGALGRAAWLDRLTLVAFVALMAYVTVTYSHGYQPV